MRETFKLPSGRVILVRHGSTVLNATTPGESAERIRGWLDVPLDEGGKEEAADTASRIAGEYCVDQIYSSDLDRALETAQHLSDACHVGPPTQDDALRPWNVGDWAGEPTAEVLPHMQMLVDSPEVPAPGGESFSAFAKRFLRRFQGILQEARATSKTIAVVSHTRNVQLVRAWLAQEAPPDLSYDPACMNDYSTELKPGDYLVLVPSA